MNQHNKHYIKWSWTSVWITGYPITHIWEMW